MKQEVYATLVDNLEEMVKQYRLLLECVRKEKELLISTNIEKLNQNNFDKEQILTRINSIENLRIDYAIALAKQLGANEIEPRLLEMAQKIGGTEGDKLRTIHSSLELLTTRILEINKESAVYAESALSTVNSAMENIKDTLMGQKTYQKKGSYQQGFDKSGHLVSKEA